MTTGWSEVTSHGRLNSSSVQCIDARITVTFVPRLSIRVSRVVSVELCTVDAHAR